MPYAGPPSGPPPESGRDPKLLLLVLGTVGVVVVAGVIAFLLLNRHGPSSPPAAASSSTASSAPSASNSAGPSSASTAPRTSSAVTATPEAQPGTGAVPLPLVATGADCTFPPSVDGNNQPVTYEPGKAADGDSTTAWRCPGAGGHTIQLTPGETGYVTDLGLIPGYAKVDPATGVNRFTDNHTVTQVVWRLTEGTQVLQVVQDIPNPTPQMAWVRLSRPVAPSSITLTVTATGNPGAPKDSTPISTIAAAGGLGTPPS